MLTLTTPITRTISSIGITGLSLVGADTVVIQLQDNLGNSYIATITNTQSQGLRAAGDHLEGFTADSPGAFDAISAAFVANAPDVRVAAVETALVTLGLLPL